MFLLYRISHCSDRQESNKHKRMSINEDSIHGEEGQVYYKEGRNKKFPAPEKMDGGSKTGCPCCAFKGDHTKRQRHSISNTHSSHRDII